MPFMDIVITVRKGFSLENPADVAAAVSRLLEKKNPLFQGKNSASNSI